MKNPFKPVTESTKTPLKIPIYGVENTGKTRAALTFPRPALMDVERKANLHAGMPGVSHFSALPIRTLEEAHDALSFIEEDAGKTFDTLIIDSLTPLYITKLEELRRARNHEYLSHQERGDINRIMTAFYSRLAHLPVHVVAIARETIEYDKNMKPIGIQIDAKGDTEYSFDFIIHMQKDYSGIIERETGQLLTKSMRLVTVGWGAFEDALRNRNKPWYDKPEKITVILERAKKYFAPISTHNRIREALFELLKIKQWRDLGEDESVALQKIADSLNKNPDESSDKNPEKSTESEPDSGTDKNPDNPSDTVGTGYTDEGNSFAKSVASAKQKAEETNG